MSNVENKCLTPVNVYATVYDMENASKKIPGTTVVKRAGGQEGKTVEWVTLEPFTFADGNVALAYVTWAKDYDAFGVGGERRAVGARKVGR